MRWWKAIGLAGAAGVVATGLLVVRGERRRRAYTPDQVREQLHVRYAQVVAAEAAETTPAPAVPGPRAWVGRWMARGRRLAERIAKRRGK